MGNRPSKTDWAIGVASKPPSYLVVLYNFGGVTEGRDIILVAVGRVTGFDSSY
jgi:hypothetical protein